MESRVGNILNESGCKNERRSGQTVSSIDTSADQRQEIRRNQCYKYGYIKDVCFIMVGFNWLYLGYDARWTGH